MALALSQADEEAWMDVYMVEAVAFLSEYFDIKEPRVVVNCEETCGYADECPYLACYMPWRNTCNFKSYSEKGIIASHEVGHALQKFGVLAADGELSAIAMERWWERNVNEYVCDGCGNPLFVSDFEIPGVIVNCGDCGAEYRVISLKGDVGGFMDEVEGAWGGEIVVSRNVLLSSLLVVGPVLGGVVSGYVFDSLPREGLSEKENDRRRRRVLGGFLVGSALGGIGYQIMKEPTP